MFEGRDVLQRALGSAKSRIYFVSIFLGIVSYKGEYNLCFLLFYFLIRCPNIRLPGGSSGWSNTEPSG